LTLAGDKERRLKISQTIETLKERFYWEKITQPLIDHCQKVLANTIQKKRLPGKKDILYISAVKKDSFLKKTAKRYLWKYLQRLPEKPLIKIRRFIKYFS
jgi:hypothetical protein